jgi:hypothetical protein
MYERSARRQFTITMETVPNDLDDDTHKAMDDEILDTMGDDPYVASSLLTFIVNASSGRLDHKYVNPVNTKALIKANPKLKEMLDIAWKSKSFRTVRNLSWWTFSEDEKSTEQKCRNLAFFRRCREGIWSTPLRRR